MALSTACALNATHDSLSLLNEEVYQLRKVALQIQIALQMLTATQGGACALVGTECCICVPDFQRNVSQALRALTSKTHATERLTVDLLQEWSPSITSEWWWVLAALGTSTCVLIACC